MNLQNISKVLVANRGEIAIRIMRTCRELGVKTVAVYSEADKNALHVAFADEAVCLGPAAASESYLRVDKILQACKDTGADALHPGYGFFSENAGFAQAVSDAGIRWIGPSPSVITKMGSKTEARAIMKAAGVPVVPGYDGEDHSEERLRSEALNIGFPLLVKAAAGGGGKGMRVVENIEELIPAVETCKREASKSFGDDIVFLERYLERPKHIEYQIFGDEHGNVIHLFERECSIQRRHQKVVEESPSVALNDDLRLRMGEAAVAAAKAVDYSNAGTVEFILSENGDFYFLEMNTRLQVEHPVTELVVGMDLVAMQLAVADGQPLDVQQGDVKQRGYSIEVRIYAEDPANGFLPSIGTIHGLTQPSGPGIRVDSALYPGCEVSIHYDPMLGKLIVNAPTRMLAAQKMAQALADFAVLGVKTNIQFLQEVITHPEYLKGNTTTWFIKDYMPDWGSEVGQPSDLHLAIAAISEYLSASAGPSAGDDSQSGSKQLPSPWSALGSWRLGGQS